MTEHEERRAQLAAHTYVAKRWWTLPEALAWIAYREPAKAIRSLGASGDILVLHSPQTAGQIIEEASKASDVVERDPLGTLRLALASGRIKVRGDDPDGRGLGDDSLFDDDTDWSRLGFDDVNGRLAIVDELTPGHGTALRAIRALPDRVKCINPVIERTGLLAMFPEPAIAAEQSPWAVLPGERLKSYAFRPAVVREATLRREKPTERSLCEAMEAMSHSKWKQASIAATRRKWAPLENSRT